MDVKYNSEVEVRILGYFIWNYNEFFDNSDIEKSDFVSELSRKAYDLIVKYKGDIGLILGGCDTELENYISVCASSVSFGTKDEFKLLHDDLKKAVACRDMRKTATKIIEGIDKGTDTSELMQLVGDFYSWNEEEESIEEIEQQILSDMNGVSTHNKYYTGYPSLDKYLNGFIPGQFNIIAGRPSVGKSLIAVNFVMNHIEQGSKCALFSLEMTNKETLQRAYAMLSGVPMVMIKDGADEESYTMVKNTIQAFEEVRKENLFLYDNKLTLGQIVSEIRMLKKKHGVELFYIDYLGIIGIKEGESRNLDISKITRTLKLLAKELKVVIVALSQLNRQAETGDKVPQLAHLRDSGSIEQDADDILMPARLSDIIADDDDYPEDIKKQILRFYIRKNRNGPVGFVDLKVNYSVMGLQDLHYKK